MNTKQTLSLLLEEEDMWVVLNNNKKFILYRNNLVDYFDGKISNLQVYNYNYGYITVDITTLEIYSLCYLGK